ncbi:MAG: hypothetical protein QM796_05880 [Chthoniobacteraceae bacterium]
MKDEIPVSPLKSVAEELVYLRKQVKQAVAQIGRRLDAEIVQLTEVVASEAGSAKIPMAKVRDARDMLAMLRNLEIRPEKAKRRDLKKVEGVLEELQRMLENW